MAHLLARATAKETVSSARLRATLFFKAEPCLQGEVLEVLGGALAVSSALERRRRIGLDNIRASFSRQEGHELLTTLELTTCQENHRLLCDG